MCRRGRGFTTEAIRETMPVSALFPLNVSGQVADRVEIVGHDLVGLHHDSEFLLDVGNQLHHTGRIDNAILQERTVVIVGKIIVTEQEVFRNVTAYLFTNFHSATSMFWHLAISSRACRWS